MRLIAIAAATALALAVAAQAQQQSNDATVGEPVVALGLDLEQLADHIRKTSHCGLGQSATNPVLSTIRHFREEYEAHIKEKRCPALSCVPLIRFRVNEEKCKKCGLCYKACPVGAISWEKKQPAKINRELCTKCRSCIRACKFWAIE